MLNKKFILSWIIGFVPLFLLNGLFHFLLAGSLFDKYLAHLSPAIIPMKQGSPIPVAILDFILAFTMIYFISRELKNGGGIGTAIFTGGLLNFTTAVVFNLANSAMFHWSIMITVIDIIWHMCLGAAIGGLMAWIYLKGLKD